MGGNAPPQGLNIGYQLTIYNLYYDVHRFPSGPSNLSLACIGCIGPAFLSVAGVTHSIYIMKVFMMQFTALLGCIGDGAFLLGAHVNSSCGSLLYKWALNPIPNLLIPRCLWLNNRLNHLLQLLNLLLVSDLNTYNIRSKLIAE